MKKLAWLIPALIVLAVFMTACSIANNNSTTTSSKSSNNIVVDSSQYDNSSNVPVNYMDEIKSEIHDELFREATEETLDIVNRIFKHLDIETVSSSVNGEDAVVLMNVTTIDAGKAWVIGLEKYAILCAENLFAETYADDATLYECYLEEFEKAVRKADYITIPIAVEMEYKNQRWEWDIDDDVVNAITGRLLAAIEGDINSFNIEIIPEVDVEIVPPTEDGTTLPAETDPEIVEPEQNNTSPIIITGYDIATGHDDQKCLVVKYKWTNTTEQTTANWSEISIKAYQNGVQLDTNFAKYESSYDELDDNRNREIRPGVTLEMVRFFTLKDPNFYNDIEIEFSNYWESIIYATGVTAF